MIDRDTIFISHATPEDNEFTVWLSSRLILLGYNVWIDKNDLIGGEKFWEEIDSVIRHHAVKFILVYSKNINYQKEPGKLKEGIANELSLAKSISKENKLSDYIILLNIDNSRKNLFIGADTLNHILFHKNWADGFNLLTEKLKKDLILPGKPDPSDFYLWYEKEYLSPATIFEKKEMYYSNWWPVEKLPDKFYIYIFENNKQALNVANQIHQYPISKIANYLSSFSNYDSFPIKAHDGDYFIRPKCKHEILIEDLLYGQAKIEKMQNREIENHFRHLLQRTLHLLLKRKNLYWTEMSNKTLAYYYILNPYSKPKVKFTYQNKENRKYKIKNLVGKYKDDFWHYAVSAKVIINPIIAFSLKNHLVFTNDGKNVWKDSSKIHTHRRAKGKRFFNDEWRDLLLAFLQGLTDKNNMICIELSPDFQLEMRSYPEIFWSEFGYNDPEKKIYCSDSKIDDELAEESV